MIFQLFIQSRYLKCFIVCFFSHCVFVPSSCSYYHMQFHIMLFRTTLYHNMLFRTTLYHNMLFRTILYHNMLFRIILYCTVLYCTVLYYTVLYCTVLYLLVYLSPTIPPTLPLLLHQSFLSLFTSLHFISLTR